MKGGGGEVRDYGDSGWGGAVMWKRKIGKVEEKYPQMSTKLIQYFVLLKAGSVLEIIIHIHYPLFNIYPDRTHFNY